MLLIQPRAARSMKLVVELLLVYCVLVSLLIGRSQAQAATDPSEVRALNSIFQHWEISAGDMWNISGEPCSGAAIDSTDIEAVLQFNPGIKCNCSYDNQTTCHITQLSVYALNVRGVIPEELTNLPFLTFLKLDQNYLTGPLPAFLGNLSQLQTLSVGINALSGTIPEELGRLRNLRILAFGTNNFSGTLPAQLGSLINLEGLYIDSSGVSGEIPNTFANLLNMQSVWASDIPLTGNIPDFIGNWSQLNSLRFQGNSFEGPIPSSFSRLTLLRDLRISDLSNVSSSLNFIEDMKDLTNLILRNNLLIGSIPSNIGEFHRLEILDLGFNNLSGQIPSSVFTLRSLSYLILGANNFSGPIHSQKSVSLLHVDLSFNRLSGGLPSWGTQRNLRLNVVANNLIIESSNNSLLASGLNCLQRQFPCNTVPQYFSFAINCGGPEIISSDGTLYESENPTLSPASYITTTRRWAVSNAGVFGGRTVSYVLDTSANITGTLDPELFQTARRSPGSLRYYGLGLENGPYNVKLQFAETGFVAESTRSWRSLGKRFFDIYLQGSLHVKNFNIREQAGGLINRAVVRDYKVEVSNNFLEIHLFWAGKGTCCVPQQDYYGPLLSTIKVTPDFEPRGSALPLARSTKNRAGLIVGITIPLVLVSVICAFVIFYLRRKRSSNNEEELLGIENMPNAFSYAELRNATRDFSPAHKLGEGGFGPVYKGVLFDGREIAVKKLLVTSHQGKSQFVAEISTISAVQHRNLVKLCGYCIEGENRLLVYEYLKNGSLDQALFGKSALHLDWRTRYNICLGVARGLAYLHEESKPRIIHRDVKASNILLDTDLDPKISDFGLAKLYDDKKTHSTRVAGTIGYLAPEYALRGHLTEKADIFSFGVVALELLCGRKNSDATLNSERIYLLEWAWSLYESNCGMELVDPTLTSYNEEEAIQMLGIALLCTQASPTARPSMSQVVGMLTGDFQVSTVTVKPGYLTDWGFSDTSACMSDHGTSETTNSRYYSSSIVSTGYDVLPVAATQPMLQES